MNIDSSWMHFALWLKNDAPHATPHSSDLFNSWPWPFDVSPPTLYSCISCLFSAVFSNKGTPYSVILCVFSMLINGYAVNLWQMSSKGFNHDY